MEPATMGGVWVREVGSETWIGEECLLSIIKGETTQLCFMEGQVGEPMSISPDQWLFLKPRLGSSKVSGDMCSFCAVAVKLESVPVVAAEDDDDHQRDDWACYGDGKEKWWYVIKEVVQFTPIRCSYRLLTADHRAVLTYQMPVGDEAVAMARAAKNGKLVETREVRLTRLEADRESFANKYGLLQKASKHKPDDQGTGAREDDRRRAREIKLAKKQLVLPFVSNRKNARAADSCCESFSCSHQYQATSAAPNGLDSVTSFRTKFAKLTEQEGRSFLEGRNRTNHKGERTWLLETPKTMQRLVTQDKPISLDVHGLDLQPVCVDFMCYALGVSRNKLSQPTVPSPHPDQDAGSDGW